jgi:hypothetical protein
MTIGRGEDDHHNDSRARVARYLAEQKAECWRIYGPAFANCSAGWSGGQTIRPFARSNQN